MPRVLVQAEAFDAGAEMARLGAENRTQLALRACHLGVRPPPDL